MERRRGEPGCGRNRRGGAEIESPRNVSSRRREHTVGGIAPGFVGDSSVGLAGLVSRVSPGRGGGRHGGTRFFPRGGTSRGGARALIWRPRRADAGLER